jgi:Flp pilus assembly protein TadG
MKNFARKMILRLASETSGAEIAEAAAVLPLMFMILLGIFWFGQAFSIYGAINRAAHDGARAGSIYYCVTCIGTNNIASYSTNAINAVNTALTQSKLDPTQTRYPAPPLTFNICPGITGGTPNCQGTSTNVCVQMPVQISNPSTGATGACGISVSFQYPYQFWLPFSSLNKQKIYLNASAQVSVENP